MSVENSQNRDDFPQPESERLEPALAGAKCDQSELGVDREFG